MSWRNGNGKVNKKATDHYGNVKGGGGGGGASIDDFENSDTIEFEETRSGKVTANAVGGGVSADDFTGSNTINFTDDVESGKPQANLEANLVNRIQKALVTPIESPEETELVGITDQGAQARIEIGEGLVLEDNELKVSDNIIDLGSESGGRLTEAQIQALNNDPYGIVFKHKEFIYRLTAYVSGTVAQSVITRMLRKSGDTYTISSNILQIQLSASVIGDWEYSQCTKDIS